MYSVTVCTTQILTYVLPYILKYMYFPRVCLQICTLLLCTCFHYPITTFSKYVGNKDMTRVLLYNICWHIFCSLNHQNCRMYYSTAHKTFLGFFCSLESLAAHRCGRDEFRISKIDYLFWFFQTAPAWGKHQQLTNIRNSTRPNRWATKDIKQFLLKPYIIRK